MTTPATPDVLEVLVENHRRFLAFLERRVGSRVEAEDILQDAFVRSLDRGDTVRDPEAVIPWFYRLLRNAVIDHHRRRGAEDRALAYAAGTADEAEPGADEALRDEVCACVAALVETLKPEYATAIKRVDLDGAAVSEFASRSRYHCQQRRSAVASRARGAAPSARAVLRNLRNPWVS